MQFDRWYGGQQVNAECEYGGTNSDNKHFLWFLLPPPPLCDMCTDRLSDDITSYGFPTAYRGNMLCRVTISRPSDAFCAFEMHFREFDVEKSSRCDRDFL
ncbi:hypothetical protein HPB49_009293 [Dermacentor silvarum]|uniref:Uncharacterized protein n=1 Tax=Dermacentor silvarum TaxID=543639 RepID=A0ACB8DYC4_DERSI|nr:hypothetical protein HPB49_009293 [Dermacentor silvarum]